MTQWCRVVEWGLGYYIICSLLLPVLSFAVPVHGTPQNLGHMQGLQQVSKLLFTENLGQVMDDKGKPRPDVLFTAHSGGTQVFLTTTGISYQFNKITYPERYDAKDRTDPRKQAELAKDIKRETYKFSLTLAGANGNPVVRKELKNEYTENFYTTGCLDGITNVGTYERVVYQDVYPHIDWIVYSNGNKLKYDFLVHPGGEPKQIRLKIDDAQSVQITDGGELVMKTTLGEVYEQTPVSYAGSVVVKTAFKKNSDGSVGFEVGAYDGELRIDPSVEWATYYGNWGEDVINDCAVDNGGNIYMVGYTTSSIGIASQSGYQTSKGGIGNGGDVDAFLVKFDTYGNRIWGTYYGGPKTEFGVSCCIDNTGNSYITGVTGSVGLATVGSYQYDYRGSSDNQRGNAFLAKFDPGGARLWATYYGDTSAVGQHCKTDMYNNVYLSGTTNSVTTIATVGTYQQDFTLYSSSGQNKFETFLVKFDSSGLRKWGTYCSSGNGYIFDGSLATDANSVYVAGVAGLLGTKLTSAFLNTVSGTNDILLLKFSYVGSLQWARFVGGESSENISYNSLATDAAGNIYIGGTTGSLTDIATPNTYLQQPSGGTFLVKYNSNGNKIWGTYYGANQINSVSTDDVGNVYVGGITVADTGIATPNGFQTTRGGGSDGTFAIFDTAGERIWATYYGGASEDYITCIAPDRSGSVYAAGLTRSSNNIVTENAYDTANHTGRNSFLVKFSNPPALEIDSISDAKLCVGDTFRIHFNATQTFLSSNLFTAELSGGEGNFASSTVIGALAGAAAGTITAIIPPNTLPGNNYRVRVRGNSPAYFSKDNGQAITINHLQIFLGNDTILCNNDRIIQFQLNTNTPQGTILNWSTGSHLQSIVVNTGIYWLTGRLGACVAADTISIHSRICNCTGNVPNAFTPNGDGKNDLSG